MRLVLDFFDDPQMRRIDNNLQTVFSFQIKNNGIITDLLVHYRLARSIFASLKIRLHTKN